MLGYYGGRKPSSKEEGALHRKKWMEWIEGLGDQVVNSGTPLMHTQMVSLEKVEESANIPMNGYAVIQAKSFEAALKIAKSDPFLSIGGKIQVSQMMEMK